MGNQFSMPWGTTGVGDGVSPFTEDQTQDFFRMKAMKNGVIYNAHPDLGNLAVTAGSGEVSVETGVMEIEGIQLRHTVSASTISIPTPSVSTRVDKIVGEVDWTAKTLRLARVSGTEGAGEPTLTQNNGTLWQESLAQVSVAVDGSITVKDKREYTNLITKKVLVPAVASYNSTDSAEATVISYSGVTLTANKNTKAAGYFCCPEDLVEIKSCKPVLVPVSGGIEMRVRNGARYATDGEQLHTTHTEDTYFYTEITLGGSGLTNPLLIVDELALTLPDLEKGDLVGFQIERDAASSLVENQDVFVDIMGWLVEYVAVT